MYLRSFWSETRPLCFFRFEDNYLKSEDGWDDCNEDLKKTFWLRTLLRLLVTEARKALAVTISVFDDVHPY